jgi:hypothetical protein
VRRGRSQSRTRSREDESRSRGFCYCSLIMSCIQLFPSCAITTVIGFYLTELTSRKCFRGGVHSHHITFLFVSFAHAYSQKYARHCRPSSITPPNNSRGFLCIHSTTPRWELTFRISWTSTSAVHPHFRGFISKSRGHISIHSESVACSSEFFLVDQTGVEAVGLRVNRRRGPDIL